MTGKEDDEFCREQLSGERSSAKPERELTEQVEGQETVLQVEGLDKGSDEGLAETRVMREQVVGPVQLEGLGKGPEEGLDKGLAETEVTAEVMEGEEGPLLAESRLLEAGKQIGEPELIECRICQEEDEPANLDMPCACTGSVKYAHPKCVQRWSNEKGDAVCEICHQPYKGYTAVPRPQPPVSVALPLEFADDWALAGQRLSDPRLLHQYALDVDYNEYDGHASTTAWCRSAALIFMALLLLRHALGMIAAGADDDESPAIFTVFLLKAIGFILPCYIMARAISIAQRRRQQQDAMAYFVQQGHVRGVPIVVAPRRLPEGVV